MLRSIGLPELVVILVVAVLLFGGKKLPELAKGLGEGIKNFKTALKSEEHVDGDPDGAHARRGAPAGASARRPDLSRRRDPDRPRVRVRPWACRVHAEGSPRPRRAHRGRGGPRDPL